MKKRSALREAPHGTEARPTEMSDGLLPTHLSPFFLSLRAASGTPIAPYRSTSKLFNVMSLPATDSPLDGCTTSIATAQGRVIVHISKMALLELGADDEQSSLTSTLRLHMPKLRALALQLAHREKTNEVHIRDTDVWWASLHVGDVTC